MRLARRPAALAIAAALSVALLAVGVSGNSTAARSDASSAKHPSHKLPDEDWVFEHWFPFNEATLYQLLDTDHETVRVWLHPPRHTIAQLGRRRGFTRRALTERLIARWRGHVSAGRLRVFRARTRLVLTDNFVSRHMIGHLFHTRTINRALPRVLGEPLSQITHDYRRGKSWVDIARRHGHSHGYVRRALLCVLRRTGRRGAHLKETSFRQPHVWYLLQKAALDRWITRGH